MLSQDHPDDERLSALAAGDTDALSDAETSTHVTSCDRCAGIVEELGVLRVALADLPDVAPHRPLRLLPAAEAESPGAVDGLARWARRLFAPALTAGAALAMVGMVGTAIPGLGGMASSQSGGAASEESRLQVSSEVSEAAAASDGQELLPQSSGGGGGQENLPLATEQAATGANGYATDSLGEARESAAEGGVTSGTDEGTSRDFDAPEPLQAERSPWPMVLFAGLSLMIAAALLRWILVPRAA